MSQLSLLTDRELVGSLERTVGVHRRNMASIVEHLAEMDARGAALDIGHGSLFAYCVNALHFTEDEACRRINAARLVRRFAQVLPRLADGSVSLTVLALLKPYLTESTCDELLELVSGVTAQVAKERLAARFPLPDAPALIRAFPGRRAAGAPVPLSPSVPVAEPAVVASAEPPPQQATEFRGPEPARPAPLSKQLVPRSADRFTLRITVDRSVKEKLDRARGLLSHRVPSGDLEAIVSLAIDELVQRLEAKKFGATKRPRPGRTTESRGVDRANAMGPIPPEQTPAQGAAPPTPPATRAAAPPKVLQRERARPRPAIPNDVRRAVVARDGARCSHIGVNGRRCEATSFLEFDHVQPVALGGPTDAANLRILCRAHNQREAERVFGSEYMRARRRRMMPLTVKEPRPIRFNADERTLHGP